MSVRFQVTLAKKYKDQDVDDWWCSEKLDGVRAIWDGHRFWSRQWKPIQAPPEFTSQFPEILLDGELFAGRGHFDQTSSIVRKKKPDYNEWQSLEFHVFDCISLDKEPFKVRYKTLNKLKTTKHLKVCQQTRIKKKDIEQRLQDIVSKGGEGLMLRKPGVPYQFKRTDTLLKVKQRHDAEAVVIGYELGSGKYRGMTGSLMCEYKGKMFKCGSGLTDELRRNPPKMGQLITFSYFEITQRGVPRFPTFKRIYTK